MNGEKTIFQPAGQNIQQSIEMLASCNKRSHETQEAILIHWHTCFKFKLVSFFLCVCVCHFTLFLFLFDISAVNFCRLILV